MSLAVVAFQFAVGQDRIKERCNVLRMGGVLLLTRNRIQGHGNVTLTTKAALVSEGFVDGKQNRMSNRRR